jgi:glycogen(starch) synthase
VNVALFASSFHPHLGGVEEVVRQLAHAQQRRGDQPLVVTNRWPKDLPAAEAFEGLPVRRYCFRVPEPTWRQLGGAVLFGPGALRSLCGELRDRQTELIHVHCVSSNAYYALAARQRLGLPLVVTLHAELTMDANRLFQRSAFARRLMRRVLTEADAVTACSARTLSDAEAFLGRPLGVRARVIYNGCEPDAPGAAEHTQSRPYILAMGRLVLQKGFDLLIRAYDLAYGGDAAPATPPPDLLIAGDGPERGALERLVATPRRDGSIRLLGRVDHAAARSLVRGSSLYVLSSRSDEGLPMVLMEAMAAGRPVIAPAVGGIPELVEHGQTGWMVDREDVGGLAAALRDLWADPLLRDRLGAAASARVAPLSWSAIADEYSAIYCAASQACEAYCGGGRHNVSAGIG